MRITMYYDYDSKTTEVPKHIVVKPNMVVESELWIRKDGSFVIETREIKENNYDYSIKNN